MSTGIEKSIKSFVLKAKEKEKATPKEKVLRNNAKSKTVSDSSKNSKKKPTDKNNN
ncbi:hypothetical protein DPMN_106017 [Dreissena polymorpha]|uniref:Uncharacterized protein n=1 Tax=Dreissena polymorpha TaxID=45954 RepID=A0A9D4QI05_DREPO|nr:hypothetical protein DPMN_106017 [Dreissena polymorpha]